MKIIAIIIILIFSNFSIYSQDNVINEIKTLISTHQFDKIIEKYSTKSNDFSSEGLYYIGLAYYLKEDNSNCMEFMSKAIEKDSAAVQAYYIRASTLNYINKFEDAIKDFKSAIALQDDNAEYYSGLGDSYYHLKKFDLSLESYKKATKQLECPDRPYSMIAQIYSDQKNNEKALESFYVAKSKISRKSDSYINALFNIGLFESLKGNYDKAEPIYLELLQIDSNDFHTCAKLIQVYYSRKEYDKAKTYKDKLYTAYKKRQLKDNMSDMFCFDQFKWKDKLIQAFERYEENSKDVYRKHVFYVVNQNGDIDFRIQTEHSLLSEEQGYSKYLLCMTKGNIHSTFNIGFNDNFKYDDLRKSVIDILENKVKPSASSNATK